MFIFIVDGGEEEDEKVAQLSSIFNASGTVEMCLDLIAKGINSTLQVGFFYYF